MKQEIYTVSQLNAQAKLILEDSFESICIMGEISNLACPISGHLYFSLKDKQAQVRCALFKPSARRLKFKPENGQAVLIHGRVSLYEPRGEYQLIATNMELAGDGALQLAFEQLKRKLAAAGLFEPSHKKPIPPFVQTIGIITSPSGAAIRDILTVMKRRCKNTNVIIYPTQVQGNLAAKQIVEAIDLANQRDECDILLLSRGGGSLEDLWPFNEEIVARAVFKSQLPIVSGVGHEIDFTISDFVADLRAATPSAAAEMVSLDTKAWFQQIQHLFHRLHHHFKHQLHLKAQSLMSLQKRLRDPRQQLIEYSKILAQLNHHLKLALTNQFKTKTAELSAIAQQLDTVSPLRTLDRGYAIATKIKDPSIIRNAKQVEIKETIQIQLSKGKLFCSVDSKSTTMLD